MRMSEQGGERMIVRLDFHVARKTDARTWWTVLAFDCGELELSEACERGLIRRVFHTLGECEKTHWYEYFIVLVPGLKFVRHRISNRGNYSREEFEPEELLASEDEIPPQSRGERNE